MIYWYLSVSLYFHLSLIMSTVTISNTCFTSSLVDAEPRRTFAHLKVRVFASRVFVLRQENQENLNLR